MRRFLLAGSGRPTRRSAATFGRPTRRLAATVGLVVVAGLAGCDAIPLPLPALSDPELKAGIMATRYMAGQYPGTISSTHGDPYVVYQFSYTNGVTLWALLLLHEQTSNPAYLAQVRASMAKYDAGNLYRPERGKEPIDYLGSMAHATLEYCLRSGDERYLEHALRAARYFREQVARTPEGLIAYHHRPQQGRIWADALFMVAPLMAKAGRYLGDESYYDDVLFQFRGFSDKLRNPTAGLYHQGWNWHGPGPTPGFWGRANGWVLMAKTEVLDTIPDGYPGRDELLSSYQDFSAALAAQQGLSGMWHQLLNRPDSYPETSCTAMFIYGLTRGVQRGWLDESYIQVVERGYGGLSRMISLNGGIDNVCPGTGPQASEGAYFTAGPRRNDPHGIGPAMLAHYAIMSLREPAP